MINLLQYFGDGVNTDQPYSVHLITWTELGRATFTAPLNDGEVRMAGKIGIPHIFEGLFDVSIELNADPKTCTVTAYDEDGEPVDTDTSAAIGVEKYWLNIDTSLFGERRIQLWKDGVNSCFTVSGVPGRGWAHPRNAVDEASKTLTLEGPPQEN